MIITLILSLARRHAISCSDDVPLSRFHFSRSTLHKDLSQLFYCQLPSTGFEKRLIYSSNSDDTVHYSAFGRYARHNDKDLTSVNLKTWNNGLHRLLHNSADGIQMATRALPICCLVDCEIEWNSPRVVVSLQRESDAHWRRQARTAANIRMAHGMENEQGGKECHRRTVRSRP